MKKIAVIMIATVFGVIGTSSAHAQTPPGTSIPGTPELCDEADTRPPNVDCDVVFPGQPNPYPPEVGGPTTTVAVTTTTQPPAVAPPTTVPPATLPSTGSSGTSGLLQLGALLLTGGLLVVIAARRRSTVRPTPA